MPPTQTQLTIPDMACSACSAKITTAIQALDAAAQIQADLTSKVVTIDSTLSAEALRDAIVAAGYSVTLSS
jgi:copper chaperone